MADEKVKVPEVVTIKEEEVVEPEVFGKLQPTLNPEDSPLNTNGYTGVDPNFQRAPLK